VVYMANTEIGCEPSGGDDKINYSKGSCHIPHAPVLDGCLDQEGAMFGPITIPFGAKMLLNTVKLKPDVTFDQMELAVGEMCMIVKETYGGKKGGFIAGQVFKFSGFVSDEGSLSESRTADEHYAIVTYWYSFEDHEKSHADAIFNRTFAAVATMCSETKELGYDMLWQGAAKAS